MTEEDIERLKKNKERISSILKEVRELNVVPLNLFKETKEILSNVEKALKRSGGG